MADFQPLQIRVFCYLLVNMIHRHLTASIEAALTDTPAVMVIGARQCGKTTLVQSIASKYRDATYVTLDELNVLDAATNDPSGFIAGFRGMAIIDEIQKAPAILPAIKASIDRNRLAGRFLLTGSANVLTLPRVSESLAGRLEFATLWPMSQGELSNEQERFIDDVFRGTLPRKRSIQTDILQTLVRGGYPESVNRSHASRRRAFFESYVTTLVSRDVRDIANIDDPLALRRLLQLTAARSATLLNASELSRSLGLPVSTLKRYMSLLETLFLVREVGAWSSNRGKRLVRSAKLHVVDTGLLAALAGLDVEALRNNRQLIGALLESFVVAELTKQLGWSTTRASLFHFRTSAGREVDVVLEDSRGRIVGIEVKAGSTVTSSDFAGLRELAATAGKAFVQGLVLHLGAERVAFGPNLTACPIDVLWS